MSCNYLLFMIFVIKEQTLLLLEMQLLCFSLKKEKICLFCEHVLLSAAPLYPIRNAALILMIIFKKQLTEFTEVGLFLIFICEICKFNCLKKKNETFRFGFNILLLSKISKTYWPKLIYFLQEIRIKKEFVLYFLQLKVNSVFPVCSQIFSFQYMIVLHFTSPIYIFS